MSSAVDPRTQRRAGAAQQRDDDGQRREGEERQLHREVPSRRGAGSRGRLRWGVRGHGADGSVVQRNGAADGVRHLLDDAVPVRVGAGGGHDEPEQRRVAEGDGAELLPAPAQADAEECVRRRGVRRS